MLITRRLEFDAGHRIPSHHSKCRHLHGHRYAIEVTLSGTIITEVGVAEQGMVMDYSEVKRIANVALVDLWDHAFLVYRQDIEVLQFLQSLDDHKTVVLDFGTRPPERQHRWYSFYDVFADLGLAASHPAYLELPRRPLPNNPPCHLQLSQLPSGGVKPGDPCGACG